MRKTLLHIYLCLCFIAFPKGILEDKETAHHLKKSLDHIYNYEFRTAEKYLEKIRAKHPHSPVYNLVEAIKMNLEYPELVADESDLYKRFHQHIKTTILWSERDLKVNPEDFEAIFFKLTALSLTGLKFSQAKQYSKAMNIAKTAYEYAKKAMKYKTQFHEFYFTSGLYNYYVVQFPESHPIIKPFMVFFQDGNKALGLTELQYTTQHTTFSVPEAYNFLSNIYFKYENNYEKAYDYALILFHKYPKNSFFQYKLCEIALMKGELKTAKACLDSIKTNKTHFYKAAHEILWAYYLERANGSNAKIKQLYTDGLAITTKYKLNSLELKCIAYMGLARTHHRDKNIPEAKNYYKLAIESTPNNYYQKEASEYLKNH
ncbi:MAG TPA: hypothetical protein VL947_02425 [Cytophagales bacterium]|nr:hypothetical protein [Cytophagales bacterium]